MMQILRYGFLAFTGFALVACASAEKLDDSLSTGQSGSGGSTKGGGATGTGGSKVTHSSNSTGGTPAGTGGVTGNGGAKSTSTGANGGTTGAYTTASKAPSCTDKLKNGDETDIDCGGTCETKCAFGKACGADTDCVATVGVCSTTSHTCTTCDNQTQDGDETDVDCGGSCVTKCGEGKGCTKKADCSTYNCDTTATPAVCGVQTNCLAAIESPCTCAENVLNAGDTAKCEAYIACYLENDCTPTTASCTSNDAACGVNKVGGGNSPIQAAAKVYDCACK